MKHLFALILCFPSLAIAGQTLLYYNSTPGDYIGQGQEVLITPETPADFSINRNYDKGVSFSLNNFAYRTDYSDPSVWWSVDFAAPYNAPLAVGSYENATRFPFQDMSEPGLSMFGSGRGCNRLSGRFDILEIQYASSGGIIRFAADFEQRCEPSGAPLYGSVRYNSDVPLNALVPAQISLLTERNPDGCIEAVGPEGAVANFSAAPTQQYESMSWSSSTGETGTGDSFSFDVGLDARETVTLTVGDATGNVRSSTATVCVSDTTPPTIEILSPAPGEVFTGNNLNLQVQISDRVDKNISSYTAFVGKSFSSTLSEGFSRVKLSKPADQSTSITVTATDASGNKGEETVDVIELHDKR